MKIYFDGEIYKWQKGGGIYRYFEEVISRCGKNKEMEVTLIIPTPSNKIIEKEGVSIKYLTHIKNIPDYSFYFIRKIMSPVNKILFERYFIRAPLQR